MKKNNIIDIIMEIILNEAKGIYGLEGSIDTLTNYCSYVQMKKENKINIGSYNVLIRNKSEYDSSTKVVEIIYKILKNNGVVEKPYKYLSREELRKPDKCNEIEEELLVIDTKRLDIDINFVLQDIKDIMTKYKDKIFIIVDEDEPQGYIHAKIGEKLIWSMEIASISTENKTDYIKKKLKENNIKCIDNSNYVTELAKKPFWEVKKELLNTIVKCKKNNIMEIEEKNINSNSCKEIESQEVKCSNLVAIKELNNLIGIEEVKKQVNQIINYIKVAKKRNRIPMLHMCFLGNPGTGKTTVARIVGKIFSEMKLLSDKKTFVEVQRSDLIGEYVGHTAPKTKKVVNKANGGVLFIDEAYSIASYIQDESGRDFGAECVATLLKEMEDKRNSLCVIMAGYTKEMENMLKVNPGFESRIQFKINFPDYNEEELYEIFKRMVKNENYKLSNNIKPLLMDFFKQEKQKENFSNARFVRNLFEKIKFEQADRVINNNENMSIIKKCDVENAIRKQTKKTEKRRQIGFVS